MYFCYFAIIYPWKRAWPFNWINKNSLHSSMLCAKFGWNWLSGSGEEGEKLNFIDRQMDNEHQALSSGEPKIRTIHNASQFGVHTLYVYSIPNASQFGVHTFMESS